MKKFLMWNPRAPWVIAGFFFLIRLLLEQFFPFDPFVRGNSFPRVIIEYWFFYASALIFEGLFFGFFASEWSLAVGTAAFEAIAVGLVAMLVLRIMRKFAPRNSLDVGEQE